MILNVNDFPTPQDAFNTANDGDAVYFPSRPARSVTTNPYDAYKAPSTGWTINKNIEIYGDGMNTAAGAQGTTIQPTSSGNIFVITNPTGRELDFLHIHDLQLTDPNGPGSGALGGHGITIDPSHDHAISSLYLERIRIMNLTGDGYHLAGGSGATIDNMGMVDCSASFCRGRGMFMSNVVGAYVRNSNFFGNTSHVSSGISAFDNAGVLCDVCASIRFIGCCMQNNLAAGAVNYSPNYETQLHFRSTSDITVIGCHFEDYDQNTGTPPARTAISVQGCWGMQANSNGFVSAAAQYARGICIVNDTYGVVTGANNFDGIETMVEIVDNSQCTNCLIEPQSVVRLGYNSRSYVKLPDTSNTGVVYDYNYAMVPLPPVQNGTIYRTRGAGFLIPRITTSDRSAIETEVKKPGLIVYNHQERQPGIWDGNSWRQFVTSGDEELTSFGATLTNQHVGRINVTNTAPATGATELAHGVKGVFLVVVYAVVRSALGAGINLTVAWADNQGARTAVSALAAAVGSTASAVVPVDVASGNVTVAASAGTSGAIDLRARLVVLPLDVSAPY